MSNTTQTYLAINFQDDTVALMGFVTEERNPDGTVRRRALATSFNVEAAIAGHVANKAWGPEKLPIKRWRFITDEEYQAFFERDYRGAVVDTGSSIEVDMPKARALHRQQLRAARGPLLAELDVALLRAEEIPNPLERDAERIRIVAEKQVLRDVTADPAIDAAATADELRALLVTGPVVVVPAEVKPVASKG